MSTWTDKLPYPANYVPPLLSDTWKRYESKERPVARGKDGFPIFAGNPRRAEHVLINAFLQETWNLLEVNLAPKNYKSGRAILELDDAAKVRAMVAILERFPWFWKTGVRQAAFFSGGPRGYSYNEPFGRLYLGYLLAALLREMPNVPPVEFTQLLK